MQTVSESGIEVALISDPYTIPVGGRWVSDRSKSAVIWTAGKYPIQEVVSAAETGFVIAKINGIYFCSCYAPPRWTVDHFSRMLDILTGEMVGRSPAVIAGDFNAWATDWGSRQFNPRGYALLEAVAKLNVDLANVGTVSTYRMAGRDRNPSSTLPSAAPCY